MLEVRGIKPACRASEKELNRIGGVGLDVLRLEGYRDRPRKLTRIGFFDAGKHLCKSTLSDTVCTDDSENLTRLDCAALNLHPEGLAVALLKRRKLDKRLAVGYTLMGAGLKLDGGIAESNILFVKESREILIDTYAHTLRARDNAEYRGFSVGDMDVIGKHIENRKVMLDNHDGFFSRNLADEFRRRHPLIDIEVGGYLIEEVEIRLSAEARRYCHTLKFSAGDCRDVAVENGLEFKFADILIEFSALVRGL